MTTTDTAPALDPVAGTSTAPPGADVIAEHGRPEGHGVPGEHQGRLRSGALGLMGNIGLALASAGPTVSIALTLGTLVWATGRPSYASPITILIIALPMLCIAAAFKYLNRTHVNCGATFMWGAKAVSPYFGFMVGWVIFLCYSVGVVSVSVLISSNVLSLFTDGDYSVWQAVIATVSIAAITGVAYIGIRVAAWLQWVLIAIEYAGLVVLAVLSFIAMAHHAGGAVSPSWSWFSWHELGGVSGFIAGALVAVFMYSGWDSGIMVNEETQNPTETPGNAVMLSVGALAFLFAFFTFSFQGAVPADALAEHGDSAVAYIAQEVGGTGLAKYMILSIALSAIGSTLATLVSAVREVFAMGADGVLPRALGTTHPRLRTPKVATILIGAFCLIGTWIYVLGSAGVKNSFDTIVSVDGLLFSLFYTFTGVTMVVYFRKEAVRGFKKLFLLLVFPLLATLFLIFICLKSVPDLGGWTGGSMIAVYIMLGIGLLVMIGVRLRNQTDYFAIQRDVFVEPVESARPE